MKNLLSQFGLRFTTGHGIWAAALIPACIALFLNLDLLWLGITLAVLIAIAAVLTVRGRRLTGWIAAVFSWRRRHRSTPDLPSEPAVGATVLPGDHVAVRWQGDYLISVIELVPRPFTPTVIVGGHAFTDDVVDTRLVEQLVAAHCPDLEADVVSAGYRVGKSAPASLVALYEQVVGPYPAPANRRTWIVLRADPEPTRKSAQRREAGVAGLARYLVASATRIADQLASNGIDARCGRSFDDFDHATEISFERETWSTIKGRSTFTAAYNAPGGPDVWWSARADHTITRVRIRPGAAPTTTVLLTTLANPTTPRGFPASSAGSGRHCRASAPSPTGTTSCRSARPACWSARPRTAIRCTCRSTTSTSASISATRGCSPSSWCGRRRPVRSSRWDHSFASSPGSSTRESGRWPSCPGQFDDLPRPASGHRPGRSAAQLHRHSAAPSASDPADQPA